MRGTKFKDLRLQDITVTFNGNLKPLLLNGEKDLFQRRARNRLQVLRGCKKHHSFHILLDLTCQQNYIRLFLFTIPSPNPSQKATLEIAGN